MSRARISTTVDARRLAEVRRRLQTSDSEIVDQALAMLLEALEADDEVRALTEHPYEQDPDLAWEAPSGPVLPWNGDVPQEVLDLAAERRSPRA